MDTNALLDAFNTFLKEANPEYKELHRIADKQATQIQRAFLLAVARVQGAIKVRQVEAALNAGSAEQAVNLIDWNSFNTELAVVAPVIETTLRQAMGASGKRLGEDLGVEVITYDGGLPPPPKTGLINYAFDLRNPQAEKWVSEHVGEFITSISDDTRRAVRTIIEDGFATGKSPRVTAREIKKIVGLTDRDAKAVVRLRAKLDTMMLEGRSPFKTPLTQKRIDRLVDTYTKKKLRQRAETIARNETITAANQGQQQLWREAVNQGLLGQGVRRKWSTARDERVCPICGPLNGQTVGLENEFSIETSQNQSFIDRHRRTVINERGQEDYVWDKDVTFEAGETVTRHTTLAPPIHVQCRCAIILDI